MIPQPAALFRHSIPLLQRNTTVPATIRRKMKAAAARKNFVAELSGRRHFKIALSPIQSHLGRCGLRSETGTRAARSGRDHLLHGLTGTAVLGSTGGNGRRAPLNAPSPGGICLVATSLEVR